MTYEELREYQTLKNDVTFYEVEINRLNHLKNEKVTYYSSPSLTNAPSGGINSPTEEIAIAQLEYGAEIEKEIKQNEIKLNECKQRLKAIDDFIENIADTEAQSLMRRHIKQDVSFRQLAREKFKNRNYISKKIRGVFK